MEAAKHALAAKDAIQEKLDQCFAELQRTGVGMSEPLLDPEGYPRSDIDVRSARILRHQIICLRNDLHDAAEAAMMAMHAAHAETGARKAEETTEAPAQPTNKVENAPGSPFARVGEVSGGSPADVAGLQDGDGILRFGSLNPGNFTSMADVARVVKHSIGQPLVVEVVRRRRVESLTLVPGPWRGQGMLGCFVTDKL